MLHQVPGADQRPSFHTCVLSTVDGIQGNARHRKTREAVLSRPTLASIVFADIEGLVLALGGAVTEREGSRVRMELAGVQWRCHRPHPGKEAKRYQVEVARELLERAGIRP